MKRSRYPVSPELAAAIKATEVDTRMKREDGRPIFTPKKNRAEKRTEARTVRRELKHDGQMTKAQAGRFEHLRQLVLTADRARIATNKRIGDILTGIGKKETKTELGIVLPSGKQIGDVLTGISARRD